MKTLIPSLYEKENIYMYCNYARDNRFKNPCKNCNNNCKHKGKETSY